MALKVTEEQIERCIVQTLYFTAAEAAQAIPRLSTTFMPPEGVQGLARLTFCLLVLRNGWVVTGESACVHSENFDEELGRETARKRAIAKVWELEGYLLRDQLAQSAARADAAAQEKF